MKRGDVVNVDLPAPQGEPGREQIGPRPALVVQSSTNLSTIVIVPITGNQRAVNVAGTVSIAASPENGLDTNSVALCLQIRALDKRRMHDVRGTLSDDDQKRIDKKLREFLGL